MPYRRYPTGLKLQYAAGALPKHAQRCIARSTAQRWRSLSIASFYTPPGADTLDGSNLLLVNALLQNGQLQKLLRLALHVILLHKRLLQQFRIRPENILPVMPLVKRILKQAGGQGRMQKLWKYLPFSPHQWSALTSRKACRASLLLLCRRKHPAQLSANEVSVIEQTVKLVDYTHWPLSSIYYQLMRDEKLHCSISTFYKYCRLLGVTRPKKIFPKDHTPLKSDKPYAMLHMDVTHFKTLDGIKHHLYVIRDNFSRAILACQCALQYSSEIAKQTLTGVLEEAGLLKAEGLLITDGGAENCGAVTDFLGRPGMLWKKLIAQVDITQSNSVVEALNKILKYRYLYPAAVADTAALLKLLPQIIEDYNEMPQAFLYGLTPNEVLAGAIPNNKTYVKAIAAARTARIDANRRHGCLDTC